MKTTYFANVKRLPSNLNFVSIARKTPPGFPGITYDKLMPTSKLLWDIKNGGSTEDYIIGFNKQLAELDPHQVVAELGQDAVLVCYEGKGKFCHRHLVTQWLIEAGYEVEEL